MTYNRINAKNVCFRIYLGINIVSKVIYKKKDDKNIVFFI